MIDSDGEAFVRDMPRDADGISGHGVYEILEHWEPTEVYIERVHAMATNGSLATFSVGDSRGSLRTAVHIAGVPLIWVPPRQWQTQFNLWGSKVSDRERKNRSRARARELWPQLDGDLNLVKDHNKAEALLIAEYGRRTSITAAVLGG